MIDPSARIHPSADLEADVTIGASTRVWPRARLRTGVHIGAECAIGRDAFLDEGVRLGDRVRIEHGALLYRGVIAADGVLVGPQAILTQERHPRAITPTGEPTTNQGDRRDPIPLGYGSSIGAAAVVVGAAIGRFAMIGAGAVVTAPVTDHALVAGNHARRMGWVCACGDRLLTAEGHPAAAEPDRYANDPTFHCERCGRRYAYVIETDGLREIPSEVRAGAIA